MASVLTLYGDDLYQSPYVFSSYVMLREKGLDFALRTFSLSRQEHRAGDYPQKSLTGRVPALQHDDFWLSESSAIDEYLEDVFPEPRLYPAAPQDRARARQIQAWLRSDLLPLRTERPTSVIFRGQVAAPLTAPAEAAAERLLAASASLLPTSGAPLFGDFSIADADLALMLMRLVVARDPVPAKIADWALRIWSRPSIQEWCQQPRPTDAA